MNATLCMTADRDTAYSHKRACAALDDLNYATTPIEIVQPAQTHPATLPSDEEELYFSFEEALSNRLTTQHTHWSRFSSEHMRVSISTDAFSTTYRGLETEPLTHVATIPHAFLAQNWQRVMICACLAFMFIMIGFDIMGLLVLHMR